ncbi:glycosyltransferase family 4 protein [Bacillota bacterium LX-D]|nr:glycosyltransferase family 4 protein [Bacillota bacterium LX-D]
MRVLMLTWEYPPHSVGGLAKHVEEISEALVKQGVDVHVLTFGSNTDAKKENRNGVIVHRVEAYDHMVPNFFSWVHQLNFCFIEEAIKLFKQYKSFHIIHAHDWLSAYAGRVLKHAYTLPLIATIHATEAGRNQGLHTDDQRYINSIEWWLTYEAWKVIVCSSYMRNEVQSLFQLPADKIKVIPNGVDQRKFTRNTDNHPKEKIIFFVGRLVREKGVQILLEAAPAILANEPSAQFWIAGNGPMEQELKQQARALGIEHRVNFLGYINAEMRDRIFRRVSLAVFPSLYEPFGIVTLEAMAAGVPVVVSDTGGMGQIVTHGVNGLKAYPGNSQSLAINVIQALKNHVLQQELKKNGLLLIDKVYNWDKIAFQTRKVYSEVYAEYRKSSWSKEPQVHFLDGLRKGIR